MRLDRRLRTDWPFKAGRTGFYYGWVIAAVSTLGFLFSIPGQTMGMAVFADEFIVAFGLDRTQLASAYLFGTLGSAFLLTRAGRWYDQYGARVMLVCACVGLGLMVWFVSGIDIISQHLVALTGGSSTVIAFVLILIGYFGVRFTGQGVLTSASRNVLLVWFEKRRGLVSGVRGVFVSLGFSIAPLLLALLIDGFGWRGALWLMAAVVGLGFAALAFLTIRDHPNICGLQVDGKAFEQGQERATVVDKTLAQARRDPAFWMYAAALSMHALFGTAVTFHVVAIFAEVGRSREEAFAYFIPQALVSVSTNLLASAGSDYMRLKPLLLVMLSAFVLGAWGLTDLGSQWGYWALVVGFGMGGGLWGVLSNLAFIRHFGVLHLGEISGLNTSLTVLASAVGPVLFSLANDSFGSFTAAAYSCMVALAVLLLVALVLPAPNDVVPK